METRRTLVGRRVLGASLIAAITSWRTRGFGLAHESTPVEETGDMQRTSTFHVTTNDRAEGAWVYRECAPGTACRQEGQSIVCDFSTGP